jgi:hypothetical protein
MSIEDSINRVITEQVQKIIRASLERINNENNVISQKLEWTETKLNEALDKLVSHNNIIADRELSGNKLDGGTITNFASTGIDDHATDKKITLTNDKITIENNLEVKGKIDCKTLFYHSATADNLDVTNSIRIDHNEVLWKNRLGNSVIGSKLQEVGVLKELNVADTLNVFKNKVGVGTQDPVGIFGVTRHGIEITTNVIGDVGFVGTVNSDPFAIGSSNEPTLYISHDNKVGIKIKRPKADLDVAGYIRYQGQIHQYLTAMPTAGTWSRGDIVWNSEPESGSVLGWVCVKSGSPGTWKSFVSID